MKSLLIFVLVALLAEPAAAQSSASPSDSAQAVAAPDPERMALARELFKTMHLQTVLQGVITGMFGQMANVLTSGAGPDAVKARDILKSMSAGMNAVMPEILDAQVAVYARDFSAQELRDATAFYGSPSGQAFLEKIPQTQREAAPLIFALLPKVVVAAEKDYCARLACTTDDHAAFAKIEERLAGMGR